MNRRVFICLKVCALAAVIGMVVTLEICRQPFGPKMCQDLCERTAGCTSYIYSASSLSCYIGNVHDGNDQKCISDKSQVMAIPAKPLSCPGNSQVIESRTRGLQCVKAGRQEKRVTPLRRKKKLIRILLYSKYSSRKTNLQIFLYKKKTKRFPIPPCCSRLYAVAYIQSIARIIVSTKQGLMIAPLDSSRYTTLNSSLRLLDMAVDDCKDLVFMLTQRKNKLNNTLITMNTTNFGYTQVHTFTGAEVRNIAIDAKRNVCYVTTLVSIISLDYGGQNVKVLHKGKLITKVTINPLLDVLYFIHKKLVMSLSLSDNKVTMSKKLAVRDLLYNANALYILTDTMVEKIVGNKTTFICGGTTFAFYRMLLLP